MIEVGIELGRAAGLIDYFKPQRELATWTAVPSTTPSPSAWPSLRYASANKFE